MPDFLIVPSANSGTDLTGAVRAGGAEPLTVSGLINGTEYVAYVLSDPSGAFTPEAVVAEPSGIFTTAAGGPYFVDPAGVPANTTRIRHKVTFRIPSSVPSLASLTRLIGQQGSGFDTNIRTVSGVGDVVLSRLEDGAGANMTPSNTDIWRNGPLDTWITIEVDADQVAEEFRFSVNGGAVTTRAFSAAGNGAFQTGAISYLATSGGTSQIPAGIEIALIETYFTTSGTETLRKRIEGNAATVNADPWKQGANAT